MQLSQYMCLQLSRCASFSIVISSKHIAQIPASRFFLTGDWGSIFATLRFIVFASPSLATVNYSWVTEFSFESAVVWDSSGFRSCLGTISLFLGLTYFSGSEFWGSSQASISDDIISVDIWFIKLSRLLWDLNWSLLGVWQNSRQNY